MSDAERGGSAPGKVYLDMPVTYLKGVGPVRAEALRRLGIVTARDLLYHIPHRYEDATTVSPISSLEPGMDADLTILPFTRFEEAYYRFAWAPERV